MCGYIMQTLIIDRYRQHGIGFPTIFNTTRPHTAIDVYISTNWNHTFEKKLIWKVKKCTKGVYEDWTTSIQESSLKGLKSIGQF